MSAENEVQTDQQPIEPPAEAEKPQPVVLEGDEAPIEQEAEAEKPEVKEEPAERDDKGRFKGVQPRIDELTRARREAEREAAYWKQLANRGNSAEAAPEKPTPDKFDDYAEYVEALTDWKAEQAVSKRMEQDSNRKVVETRNQTFMERQVQAKTLLPDYDEVVGASDAPVAAHVGEVLQDSEMGPQLAYHLAKNPEVLLKLNGMSPTQAAREMGKLEATLSTPKAPVVPVKKVSQAPSPANTASIQGRSATPTLANATMDEYIAQRKLQGARWAR